MSCAQGGLRFATTLDEFARRAYPHLIGTHFGDGEWRDMMKRTDVTDNGSWSLAEELLQRGDPQFVREVRRLTDAERLGNLAPVWYGDRRPEVRRLLFEYLDQPLNAFRHEALVKRLFKLAERAGDDE